jgi:hypothetical protein
MTRFAAAARPSSPPISTTSRGTPTYVELVTDERMSSTATYRGSISQPYWSPGVRSATSTHQEGLFIDEEGNSYRLAGGASR